MEKRKIYKRGLVIFGVIAVIGMAFYTIFNCSNVPAVSSLKKEIAREIQKIKDKGEPATVEELIPEEIPDEENAALVFEKAFKIRNDLAKRYGEVEKYFPWEGTVSWDKVPEEEKKKVAGLILDNADYNKMYQLLEKASTMKCQFLKRKDWEKGASILLPHLAKLRSCARLLAARAKLQAEKKDIEGALNTSLTGLRMSKTLSGEPLIINQLVRMAMDSIMLRELEDILKKGECGIEIYQTLIEEIEEERDSMMIYSSFLGERVVFGIIEFPRIREYAKESLRKIEEEKGKLSNEEIIEEFCKIKILGEPLLMDEMDKESKEYKEFMKRMRETYGNSEDILEDFFDNQEFYYFETMSKMVSLGKEPYRETRKKLEDFNKELQKLPQEKAVLTQMLLPALSRCYNREARTDALLGNAEIALACHIYKAKYGGYPPSLNKLTPGILPSLPLDPFTGKDYIYKKKDKGFVVYSLGDNLKDDGGRWGEKQKWVGDYDIVWESER